MKHDHTWHAISIGELAKADISNYVKDRLGKLSSHLHIDNALMLSLETAIIENTDGSYLLATMMLKEIETAINRGRSVDELQFLLRSIPRDLEKFYAAMFEGFRHPETTLKVLQIIVATVRPLTIREFGTILELKKPSSISF